MSTNVEGKVVVITGASSGLGESTARHLAGLGATVVLGARRKDRLDAIVKDITAKGGKALAFDPTRLTDGIELSDDPLPALRSRVYRLSRIHRQGQ